MYGNVMKAWEFWERNSNLEKGKMLIRLNCSPTTMLRLRKEAKLLGGNNQNIRLAHSLSAKSNGTREGNVHIPIYTKTHSISILLSLFKV
jgi:hypothetical protein